jgi:hypothetical protein
VTSIITELTMRHQKFSSVVAMTAALGLVSLVRAQSAEAEECAAACSVPDHPVMKDHWYVSGGAMWARSNVTANLNRGVLGALVDFEDDLGLDRTDVIGLWDLRWHFARRWQVEAEYFRLDRSGQKQAQRDITFGNVTVPITATANSTFNVEDFRVGLGWSFFRTQDKEVGVGIGAHVARIQASLSSQNFGSDRASETAPLPFLSLYARMALTDRWLLNVRVDRLSVNTGSIDGSVFSSGLDLIYQPWRHVGFGLGYRDINWQISSNNSDWNGKAQIQENGPMLFINGSF